MKGNLLTNIKNYLAKMNRNRFKDLNVMAYYKCLDNNLNTLEELILSSEYKEYDLSISKDEESGVYSTKVIFQYNVPNIVFHLNFVEYENIITGEDSRLEVIKTEEVSYFDYAVNTQDYENEEDLKYHKDIIENNLIEQIAFQKKYIELENKKLNDLQMQLAKLTA